MSIPVDLAELGAQIARLGTRVLLVTTSTDGPPHVTSVVVTLDEDDLVATVGRRTHANATEHPAVALVWPSAPDDDFCLIVDATASAEPETLRLHPIRAVLHKLGGGGGN